MCMCELGGGAGGQGMKYVCRNACWSDVLKDIKW